MKGSDFIKNINEIDLDLIEGAAMQKKKKTNIVRVAGIMAACLCLVVGAVFGIKALRNNNSQSEAGGTDGKLNVTSKIVFTGTDYALSEEEAKVYLETVKGGIVNELTASGIQVKDLSFSPWGVSILRSGDHGNSMRMRETNWSLSLIFVKTPVESIIILPLTDHGSMNITNC